MGKEEITVDWDKMKTEHPSVFKNEDFETALWLLRGSTDDYSGLIYYLVKYGPFSLKTKFKYWLVKKVIWGFVNKHRNFLRKFKFLHKFIPPFPETKETNYENRYFNKDGSVKLFSELFNPWKKTERKWKWDNNETEKLVCELINKKREDTINGMFRSAPSIDFLSVDKTEDGKQLDPISIPPVIYDEPINNGYLDKETEIKSGRNWKWVDKETETLMLKKFKKSDTEE